MGQTATFDRALEQIKVLLVVFGHKDETGLWFIFVLLHGKSYKRTALAGPVFTRTVKRGRSQKAAGTFLLWASNYLRSYEGDEAIRQKMKQRLEASAAYGMHPWRPPIRRSRQWRD